ncbi:MAG: hypothetical protein ABGZ24_03105, partial [Fuerstiella sp.]
FDRLLRQSSELSMASVRPGYSGTDPPLPLVNKQQSANTDWAIRSLTGWSGVTLVAQDLPTNCRPTFELVPGLLALSGVFLVTLRVIGS